jgi:hypothetical protein
MNYKICVHTITRVDVIYGGSILAETTLFTSPYKIFLNDSNGHGCYFKKCYYFNIWIIHVQSPTNLPKSMWKLVLNVIDVILKKLEALKGKPTKSIKIMPHLKFSKNMLLGQRNWKINKITTHMDMKIWLTFNHSKVPNY